MDPTISPEAAAFLKFFAFGVVWLFPIGLVIAVLGFSNADANAQEEDLGPNVVPFPAREPANPPQKDNPISRIKRLAFPGRNR